MTSNINNFTDQILMVIIIIIYLLNYFLGLWRNNSIAWNWLKDAKTALSSYFVFDNEGFEETSYFNRFEYQYLCRGNKFSKYLIVNISLWKRFEMLTFFFGSLCKKNTDKIWIEIPLLFENESLLFEVFLSSRKTAKVCFEEMAHLKNLHIVKNNTHLN